MDRDDRASWSWREVAPELAIALVALLAAGAAGYVAAGVRAVVLVAVVFAALALAVMFGLVPSPVASVRPEPGPERQLSGSSMTFRLRNELVNGTQSLGVYNSALRPRLVHLLAARLAEHHGVNLYRQPSVARSILCAGARDVELWPWIDPTAEVAPVGLDDAGIPSQTLWRLIARLEEL